MKWSWTGCHHEDNGDWARDKTAYLRLKLEGGWYQRRGCSNLQLTDWTPLTNYFLERNPTCQAFNNKTLHYVLDCPYSGKSEDNKRQNQDFKDGCERQKGHWYLRHDGPDMVLADEMVDENLLQSPLNIPERYPPKLPQSLKHMSEADCMGREDDVAKKSPQQGKDSHGWSRRVVFEEDGVKVIFVDEEF